MSLKIRDLGEVVKSLPVWALKGYAEIPLTVSMRMVHSTEYEYLYEARQWPWPLIEALSMAWMTMTFKRGLSCPEECEGSLNGEVEGGDCSNICEVKAHNPLLTDMYENVPYSSDEDSKYYTFLFYFELCKIEFRILFLNEAFNNCHGTRKTGNLEVHFPRRGKHREFSKKILKICFYTGNLTPTQGIFGGAKKN